MIKITLANAPDFVKGGCAAAGMGGQGNEVCGDAHRTERDCVPRSGIRRSGNLAKEVEEFSTTYGVQTCCGWSSTQPRSVGIVPAGHSAQNSNDQPGLT